MSQTAHDDLHFTAKTASDRPRGAVLAIALATTVAMWAIAYLAMMSPGWIIGELVVALLIGCVFAGGLAAGRLAGLGWKDGAMIGAIVATLNLMILGSVARNAGSAAVYWVLGNHVVSIVLGATGAGLARARETAPRNWIMLFVLAAFIAIILLLITGGLVTALEAGLAVPDWPTSFGDNMFLYPLAEMTGGKYFEHAHRLYGSLVGVTSILLMIALFRFDRRRWVHAIGTAVFIMVCIQGIMGGLRVEELSISLAIAHGVFAQLILTAVACIAAVVSTTWHENHHIKDGTPIDRTATLLLPILLLCQLILGALYRHLNADETVATGMIHGVLGGHILLALGVTAVLIFAAGRAFGHNRDVPVLKRLGMGLMHGVGLQLILGIAAVALVMTRGDKPEIPVLEVAITTAHQITGALLLAGSALLLIWNRRLLA